MAFDSNKVNSLYPGAVMYEPMLINKGTDEILKSACGSGDYFGQIKKDGFLYIYENHGADKTYLFSRTKSRDTNLLSEKSDRVPHILNALKCLPEHTILLGEIYYPGKTSKNVTTIMGCLPQKAIERQNGEYGLIHFYVYDILMYKGVDLVSTKASNWNRYQILQKIWEKHSLNQYYFLELAESWTDDLYNRVGNALTAGEEGMVIKKKDAPYEPGKRPITNLKAKKVDFIDAVIIGFEEPTKEYYGKELESWQYWYDMEGGNPLPIRPHDPKTEGNIIAVTKPYYMGWHNSRIKIGAYDDKGQLINIGTIHSGISDDMKQNMSEYPGFWIGKVCMIQCMELDKNEQTIRHGFFKGLRDDKNAEDCKLCDVFGQK